MTKKNRLKRSFNALMGGVKNTSTAIGRKIKNSFLNTSSRIENINKRFDQTLPKTGKVLDYLPNVPILPMGAEVRFTVKGVGGGVLKVKDYIKKKKNGKKSD